MIRENCDMCTYINGECFCDFYDFGFAKCVDIPIGHCPNGLDDDDDEDDYYDYDDDCIDEY